MELAFRRPLVMQDGEILDVEAVEHAGIRLGMAKLVFITAPNHRALQRSDDINSPRPECDDQGVTHRVFVDVEPDSAHRELAIAVARASSSANSASISLVLAW